MSRETLAAVAIALLALSSCGGDPVPPTASRTFLFAIRGVPDAEGSFAARTSDPAVLARLDAQLALSADRRDLHVSGPIERGGGGHNLAWSWHLVPDRWEMVERSNELCDGTAAMVEKDLVYWVDVVGSFCPWGSYVVREL